MTKKIIKDLKENHLIKDRTTMKVGGKAKYYKLVNSTDELVEIITWARKNKIEHLIIGGGSNLIFSDKEFDGLVVENRSSQIEVQNGQIEADSGVFIEKLVQVLAENNRQGLEFLAGIPATVGGVIINNAGAYGREVADVLSNILVLTEKGEKKIVPNKELDFSYRQSSFKGKTSGVSFPVVLRGYFKIKPGDYNFVSRKIEDYKKIRLKTNPQGFSSGCIFKNPKVKTGEMPDGWQDKVKNGRISAGFLLDSAGAKGMSVGHAYVPQKHANYIINKRKAKAWQVKQLRDKMKDLVKKRYGIILENEVEFIGKFEKL